MSLYKLLTVRIGSLFISKSSIMTSNEQEIKFVYESIDLTRRSVKHLRHFVKYDKVKNLVN